MSVVQEVKQNPKKPENAFVKFLDGTEAWCPSWEAASKLKIGEPLPPDWRQDEGDYGPRVFPPKPAGTGRSGAPAAFRNTKDGFLAEQEGRQRWQRVEEERRDRRTALMQAVIANPDAWGSVADDMYHWLRITASAPQAEEVPSSEPVRGAADTAGGSGTVEAAGVKHDKGKVGGSPAVIHAPACSEPGYSPLRKNGNAMPEGKLRCIECNVTANEADLP